MNTTKTHAAPTASQTAERKRRDAEWLARYGSELGIVDLTACSISGTPRSHGRPVRNGKLGQRPHLVADVAAVTCEKCRKALAAEVAQ